MVDGNWFPIVKGDVVADARIIRTGANGHVTFISGEQVVEMRPNSQIQISALEGRDYTWVLQSGGEITADVDARNVEHFGVQTHHMAAIVKGTRFTVVANEEGASVAVERGTVSVNEAERGMSVAIGAGQRAVGGSGSLRVEGQGNLPTVLDATGRPVVLPTATPAAVNADSVAQAHQGSGNSANAPGRSNDATANSSGSRGNSSRQEPGQAGGAPGNGNGNGNGPS